MSTTTLISDPRRVFDFVSSKNPMNWTDGNKGLGLEKDGELIAGVVYEGFNGANIWMHVAAEPGARWMTRDYLHYCFYYPFVELGCRYVRGYVEASNTAARRFDEHLGFTQAGVLQGAAADGGDVILYVMPKESCRYV
jgi:RimJ/RimL family protein N-acetyltransferase